ncbi:MAG: hypothetical protein ACAI44_06975 [Candidatus Sericytochromatia bacterium]
MEKQSFVIKNWRWVTAALLLLGGTIYAGSQFQQQAERHKHARTITNMHQLQGCVEDFAASHKGLYPENLDRLLKAASLSKPAPERDCENLLNPFTSQTGINKALSDFKAYHPVPAFAGFVFYKPLVKNGKPLYYHIFGADQSGDLLTIMGNIKPVYTVKANMFSLQTLLETYAVDHQGLYPPDVETLYRDASGSKGTYWKRVVNPFQEPPISPEEAPYILSLTNLEGSEQTDSATPSWSMSLGHWLMNYKAYQPGSKASGLVLYEPVTEAGKLKNYRIYGADKDGQLLQDNGKAFVMSNHD